MKISLWRLAVFLLVVFLVLSNLHIWFLLKSAQDQTTELANLERAGAVTGLLLKVFSGVAIAVLIYYGIRGFVLTHRGVIENAETSDQGAGVQKLVDKDTTGFVLDTFQDLIRRLKEKEQELERLRRVAEERADHIESYNENILRSVSSGVITFNPEAIITTYNLAAERILGCPASEMIGRSCGDVFGKDSAICRLVQKALVDRETTTRKELELIRRAAGHPGLKWQKIWVGISTSLLMDKQDQVIGTTLVFTDISEIKRLQEQVELRKRLTMLGEMSAGIAHEFRNYMGTIMGYAKLLMKRVRPEDTAQHMIQSIIQELQAMERLISELLDFSRTTEPNLKPVDLGMLMEKVVHQVFDQHKGPLPKLTLILSPRIAKVRLDEVLIRQAIGNLIRNAVEAMPEGGELRVQVGLKADRSRSTDPFADKPGLAACSDQEIEIEIQDTGQGIPLEVQDKIFLPFFTTKEKGTGLGLALVHKIVLSHNGHIQVDSREGKGTTFRIYLPMMN